MWIETKETEKQYRITLCEMRKKQNKRSNRKPIKYENDEKLE